MEVHSYVEVLVESVMMVVAFSYLWCMEELV